MKRLLIIRFSALGDVAMLVPVVRALAAAYPDWDITVLSRKQTAPLFEGLAGNVHYFGADLRGRHHSIAGLNTLLRDMDYKQFDLVADMHNVLRSKYLRFRFFLSGKHIAAIRKGRLSKWWLTRTHNVSHPLPTTIERYCNVLSRLGFTVSLQLTTPTETAVPSPKAGIGIAPFAAHTGKIYPLDRMEEVVRLLSEQGEKVWLFGAGEKEKAVLHDWETKYPNVESLAGRYTMAEEIERMRHLRLMLTMDSANMHLASIAGTRVLSIWGATHPAAGFLGYGQKVGDCIQYDLPCRPCSVYGNKPCRFGEYYCLDIDPAYVVSRINKALCE